jgi:hypothetical protein
VDDEDHRLCYDPLPDLLVRCGKVSGACNPAKRFGGSREVVRRSACPRERPKAWPQRCDQGSVHTVFDAVNLPRHVRHVLWNLRSDLLLTFVRDGVRLLHYAGLLHRLDRERSFVRGQDHPGLCR